MWEVKNIDPTLFNVLSDIMAVLIIWLFLFLLSHAYPYLVWTTVKSGRGVGIDDILNPPGTLPAALFRFCKGDTSRFLLLVLIVILFVETFAHTLADGFMDFQSIPIGEEDVSYGGGSGKV